MGSAGAAARGRGIFLRLNKAILASVCLHKPFCLLGTNCTSGKYISTAAGAKHWL